MGGKGALEMVIKPHAASTVAAVVEEEEEEQEGGGDDGVETQAQVLEEVQVLEAGMSSEELMAALDDMEEQVLAAP